MEQKNLYEQMYERICRLYGTRQEEEYLTLVCQGPQIHPECLKGMDRENMIRVMEEDALTNCLCAPSPIVSTVLPYTLSSRYGFALSLWTVRRQFPLAQGNITIFQSEEAFYETISKSLKRAYEIEKEVCEGFDGTDALRWKDAYRDLVDTAQTLYAYALQKHRDIAVFGEAELLEAREMLKSLRITTPSQRFVYPVQCIPNDWVNRLDSAFQRVDTLPSIYDVVKELFINANEIEELVKKLIFFGLFDAMEAKEIMVTRQQYLEMVVKETKGLDPNIQMQIFCISPSIARPRGLTAATLHCLLHTMDLKMKKSELRTLLMKVNKPAKAYWKQLQLFAKATQSDKLYQEIILDLSKRMDVCEKLKRQFYQADRKNLVTKTREQILLPQHLTPGYEAMLCSADVSSFYEESSLLDSSHDWNNLTAFFGTRIPYGVDEAKLKRMKIDVGCQITQVEIERPWFMETVFDLSFAYQRLCKECISQGIKKLNKVRKTDILPSYPISMIIAKDVTIRLDFADAGKDMMKLIKKCAVHGNGFLCFQEDTSSFHPFIENDGRMLTLRYPKPYVIGYFMRYTPKDKAQRAGGIYDDKRNK